MSNPTELPGLDKQYTEWCERHDLPAHLSREAFDDATSLHLLRAEPEGEAPQTDWIDALVLDVAELPDRDSPEEWPEAMLVTGDELRTLIALHAPAATLSPLCGAQHAESCKEVAELPRLPSPYGTITVFADEAEDNQTYEVDGWTADQMRGYAIDYSIELGHAALAAQQAAAPGALPERDLSKPAEQQGLFRKFDVRRTDDSDQPGGKHHGCRYYMLDLTHDQHAPAAMRAYAAACASTHPQLAADIVAEFGGPGTPEAPKKPAHGHRDDYYLLANGRRLGLEPISRVRSMPNWVLAMELFATGSTSAHQLCRDAGVDPDSTTTQRAAQLDCGEGVGK